MKELLKNILKKLRIYHPLQSLYRNGIVFALNKYYQLTYSKYKGKGFTCNFCNASHQKFVPEYPSDDTRYAIETNDVIAGYG